MNQKVTFPKVYAVLWAWDFQDEEGTLDKVFSTQEAADKYVEKELHLYPYTKFKVREFDLE